MSKAVSESRRRGVIAHQRDQFDEPFAAEQRQRPRKGRRPDLARRKDFARQSDDHRIVGVDRVERAAVPDRLDHLRRNALAQRLLFVRRPFELAVQFARGREDRQLAQAATEPGLVAQVLVHRTRPPRQLLAVQLDAAGTAQPPDRAAVRVGEAVVYARGPPGSARRGAAAAGGSPIADRYRRGTSASPPGSTRGGAIPPSAHAILRRGDRRQECRK